MRIAERKAWGGAAGGAAGAGRGSRHEGTPRRGGGQGGGLARGGGAAAVTPSRTHGLDLSLARALLLAAGACGDATGPADVYTLRSINGHALPLPDNLGSVHPESPLQIRAAELTLYSDGRFVDVRYYSCVSPLPAGTSCGASPIGSRAEGTYSRAAGTVTYQGDTYPATFEAARVVISFPVMSWTYER